MAFDPTTTPTPSAPLMAFLRQQVSGHDTMTPEYYDYFGGDEILKELKKFDPDAKVVASEMSGGEGGGGGYGKKFEFDLRKIPGNFGLVPAVEYHKGDNSNNAGLADPSKVWYDKNYGWVSSSDNTNYDKGSNWPMIAPLVVGAAATGGAMLGAAPAMAGVAGGTSAVTGAAAGLPAGSIPGAAGAATGSTLNAIRGGVNAAQGALRQGGNFNPLSLLGSAAGIGGSFMGLGSVMPYLQAGMMANRIINR